MTTLKNDQDALVLALKLAITAPDDERADRALQMAEELAAKLAPEVVEACKGRAALELELEKHH